MTYSDLMNLIDKAINEVEKMAGMEGGELVAHFKSLPDDLRAAVLFLYKIKCTPD